MSLISYFTPSTIFSQTTDKCTGKHTNLYNLLIWEKLRLYKHCYVLCACVYSSLIFVYPGILNILAFELTDCTHFLEINIQIVDEACRVQCKEMLMTPLICQAIILNMLLAACFRNFLLLVRRLRFWLEYDNDRNIHI